MDQNFLISHPLEAPMARRQSMCNILLSNEGNTHNIEQYKNLDNLQQTFCDTAIKKQTNYAKLETPYLTPDEVKTISDKEHILLPDDRADKAQHSHVNVPGELLQLRRQFIHRALKRKAVEERQLAKNTAQRATRKSVNIIPFTSGETAKKKCKISKKNQKHQILEDLPKYEQDDELHDIDLSKLLCVSLSTEETEEGTEHAPLSNNKIIVLDNGNGEMTYMNEGYETILSETSCHVKHYTFGDLELAVLQMPPESKCTHEEYIS